MVLSLQGCMAVGKTTALKYLEKNVNYVNVSCELNNDIVAEVKRRCLDKNRYFDYLEIQKMWIKNEIERYNIAKRHRLTVMDFGAEEIEFYTLNYPKTIGENWDVENALKEELTDLRRCLPRRVLFLDASEEVLRRRKEGDKTRSRSFFDHHLSHLLPLKRQWFIGRENVDVLNVDCLSSDEVAQKVREWVDFCNTNYI